MTTSAYSAPGDGRSYMQEADLPADQVARCGWAVTRPSPRRDDDATVQVAVDHVLESLGRPTGAGRGSRSQSSRKPALSLESKFPEASKPAAHRRMRGNPTSRLQRKREAVTLCASN